jgi:hypothetical protein
MNTEHIENEQPNSFAKFMEIKQDVDAVASRLDNMAKAFKSVLERLDHLEGEQKITKTYSIRPSQSETIGKVALALSKAQGAMKPATATGSVGMGNSTSANLGDLMEVASAHLRDNELAVVFDLSNNEFGEGMISAKLVHSSGEWLSSHCLLMEFDTMPNEKEFQKKRSAAITYSMKNLYRSLLGISKE